MQLQRLTLLGVLLVGLWLAACVPTTESNSLNDAPEEAATAVVRPTDAPPTPLIDAATAGPRPTPTTALITPSTDGYFAYVQDQNLYIQDLAKKSEPVWVDDCPANDYCRILFLKWSPDGRTLLYYHTTNNEIRLVNWQGHRQTVAQNADFVRPAAWSPDGQRLAYFHPTTETVEKTWVDIASSQTLTVPLPVMEVYTVSVNDDGSWGEPQLNGTLTVDPPGCGGGGRSPSEELYEAEGGTAYGYLMGVLEWTAQDILLYTTNCTNLGIGRYDLTTSTQLEPFAELISSLVLTPDKSRWVAVSGYAWSTTTEGRQLVTGDPTNTAVTIIPITHPVEMVFVGQHTGSLYYTSRQQTAEHALTDGSGLSFRFYDTTLWRLNADGSGETAVTQAADHAFAHVQELADGSLLFVRIENDNPLYEAIQGGLPTGQWSDYYPQRHIVWLMPGSSDRIPFVDNAGSPAVR